MSYIRAFTCVLMVGAASVAGCENSLVDRSLVFSTATTIGVEVSVSPSEASSGPVKLIIGYKRAEGVLNPVYHSQGVKGPPVKKEVVGEGDAATVVANPVVGSNTDYVERYRPDAYSVIAKISGEAKGKSGSVADAGMSVAQWFATGKAADILAVQPGIAGAVTGSPGVAEGAAKQAGFKPAASAEQQVYQDSFMAVVAAGLTTMAAGSAGVPADRTADKLVQELNSFAAARLPMSWVRYQEDPNRDQDQVPKYEGTSKMGRQLGTGPFEALIQYTNGLKSSIATLEDAIAKQHFKFRSTAPSGPQQYTDVRNATNDTNYSMLMDERANLDRTLQLIRKDIAASTALPAAAEYYLSMMRTSK